MRKVIFFVVALFASMTAYSQAGRVPFEIKRSVYFADGSLDEYTTSAWNSSYTHIYKEERYSASGAMLEQVDLVYTEAGRLSSKTTKDSESERKGRMSYQYEQKGNLFEVREQLADNKNRLLSSNLSYYDDKGNIKSRTILARGGIKLAETTYTYDSASKMTRSETKDQAENTISSTMYSYDSQGNKTKEEVRNGEGRITSITTFTWQEGREVMSEMAAPDGRVLLRISNEYGGNGELVKKTIENFQGDSKQVLQYSYELRPAPRRQS